MEIEVFKRAPVLVKTRSVCRYLERQLTIMGDFKYLFLGDTQRLDGEILLQRSGDVPCFSARCTRIKWERFTWEA